MASLQPFSEPRASVRLLERTHGYGVAHGDGAGSDGDGDAASRIMPPSFAQTNASGSAEELGYFGYKTNSCLSQNMRMTSSAPMGLGDQRPW